MRHRPTPTFDELLDFAHQLARLTGPVILPHFRQQITVDNKAGEGAYDPVTIADRAAEQVIRRHIAEHYPSHAIVGEEFGRSDSADPHSWIIDPIDGTRSFVVGLPTWGTLIGLARDGVPLLGLVDQPFTGERFFSSADAAHFDGPGGSRTLRTRPCARLADALAATTSPDMFSGIDREHFLAVKSRARMMRYGGDCLNYCLLAMGQIDLVIECGLQTYDIAALIPIIERAGGIITTWEGKPALDGGRIVAAGDRRMHDEVLGIVNR